MDFRIGMDVYEIISGIVKNTEIFSISIVVYPPSQNWSERSSKNSIKNTQRHIPGEHLLEVSTNEISPSLLSSLKSKTEEEEAIGLLSRVSILLNSPGSFRELHIPMIDFSCRISARNQKMIKQSMKEVGEEKGAILESGRSYHYYGLSLMTEEDWHRFLGKCLLLPDNIIDSRYIGHSLLEGCCCLRISTTNLRDKIPRTVAVL